MRLVSVVLLLSILSLSCACEADAADSTLLQPGRVLKESVPHDRSAWFGLYRKGTNTEVRKVKLSVRRKNDEQCGEDYAIVVKPRPGPMFLLRDSKLRPHLAKTVFPVGKDGQSEEANPVGLHFALGAREYALERTVEKTECALKLVERREGRADQEQILGRAIQPDRTTDASPNLYFGCGEEKGSSLRVIWAGDLDEDGRLDLLFKSDTDSTYSLSLFLSSHAEGAQLVRLFGRFLYPGC